MRSFVTDWRKGLGCVLLSTAPRRCEFSHMNTLYKAWTNTNTLMIMSWWDLSDSYGIMWACWEKNPEDRPSFTALVEILGDLLQTCVQQVGYNYCVFIKTFSLWGYLAGKNWQKMSCILFLKQDGKDYIPLNTFISGEGNTVTPHLDQKDINQKTLGTLRYECLHIWKYQLNMYNSTYTLWLIFI